MNTLSRTSVGLQPVTVTRNEALERFSQVIMYGGARFHLGGILSLAFAEGLELVSSPSLWAVLSSGMAMFRIEPAA